MKKQRRDYANDYVSVTSLLGILTNYGLIEWFKRTPYNQILEESKRGKEIGLALHEAIQQHIEAQEVKVETEWADEVVTALKSFMLFKKENPSIKLKRSELMLISDQYRIDGTLDCLATENDVPILLDWKSSKVGTKESPPIYDSYRWQASAYTILYEKQEKTEIHHAYVVALAKDKVAYALERIDKDEIKDNFNHIIIPCLEIYYYQRELKRKDKPNGN